MQQLSRFLIFFCFFVGIQNLIAQNNIWYVSADGSGNGTSWAQPSADLQAVINAAVAGDQVWVKQGTYQRGSGQYFSVKDGVSLFGGFPDTDSPVFADRNPQLYETVLQGNNARVLHAAGAFAPISASTLIDGFSLTNGYDTVGAGLYVFNCHATFRNLNIHHNQSSQGLGAGICTGLCNSSFIQVLVHHNTALIVNGSDGDAAAIRMNGGELNFYNCVIADNHAQGHIGGMWLAGATVHFYNGIIYGNTADQEYNTATNDNYAVSGTSNFYASHSILQGCVGSDYLFEGPQFQFYGYDMGGNLDADPLFNADYSLQAASIGKNKGKTENFESAAFAGISDFFGNPRVVDRIDIGLSENQSVQSEILYVRENGTGDGSSWENASGNLQSMLDSQFENREIWVAEGTYFSPAPYLRLRESVKVYGGFPGTGNPGFPDRDVENHASVLTTENSAIIGNFYPTGANISSATLLDGFTLTGVDDASQYRYGIFESNSSVSYSNITFTGLHYSAVELRRACNSSFTDCHFTDNIATDTPGVNYPSTFFMTDGATSHLLRCSFTGNYSFLGSAIMAQDDSHLFVDDCSFEDNDTEVMAGVGKVIMVINSEARIVDCDFDSNGDDGYDGGIITVHGTNSYADAPWLIHPLHVTVDRCTFRHNHNSAIWYQGKEGDHLSVSNALFFKNTGTNGGGIRRHLGGDFYVTNCTFTQNHASNQLGGAIFLSDTTADIPLGTSEIRNSIIYDNTSLYPWGSELYTYRPVGFRNNLIHTSGGSANWDAGLFNDFTLADMSTDLGGNLDVDPMFTDPVNENYKPLEASPVVNAGYDALYNAGAVPDLSGFTLDLDGNVRIIGPAVDMGPFEFDPELSTVGPISESGIQVYPNPAQDMVFVRSQETVSGLTLCDLEGKRLLSNPGSSLNVSDLATGIYLLEVRFADASVRTVKIIRN